MWHSNRGCNASLAVLNASEEIKCCYKYIKTKLNTTLFIYTYKYSAVIFKQYKCCTL
jgi:hypothetical protein